MTIPQDAIYAIDITGSEHYFRSLAQAERTPGLSGLHVRTPDDSLLRRVVDAEGWPVGWAYLVGYDGYQSAMAYLRKHGEWLGGDSYAEVR